LLKRFIVKKKKSFFFFFQLQSIDVFLYKKGIRFTVKNIA